jgi:hypothetical protein
MLLDIQLLWNTILYFLNFLKTTMQCSGNISFHYLPFSLLNPFSLPLPRVLPSSCYVSPGICLLASVGRSLILSVQNNFVFDFEMCCFCLVSTLVVLCLSVSIRLLVSVRCVLK